MSPETPSSPSAPPLTTVLAPYYPKCEADSLELRPLPERPRCILDEQLCSNPLLAFDEQLHETNFKPRPDGSLADQPDGFCDPYLMPSLTRNERLRLTMFWYYTRGLCEDAEFLQLLQEKLELVQTFMEWEFALLGLVSEDTFTRVAASGLPLAVVPRRESTCSHTINQEPNTVFMLPNMANDWRFRGSPPVAKGGLRSYAGVPLRCQTPTGEYVALGSLCVASNSEHTLLTPTQEGALIRFADMLVTEIVSRSRHERRRQRSILARRLAECRLDDLEDAETHILELVREVYPSTSVGIYEASDNTIPIPNHHPINVVSVQDGLWEGSEHIDELIRTANFTKISTTRTVRAIIHPCHGLPHQKFLVVASSHVQTVFDDVDSWFVEKCAISLANIVREGNLREATRAKDKFLRGITHQLRTPIHGVLASCELLTEELAARNSPAGSPDADASATSPSSIIDTIRDSAKELMTTVNNILKLNRWEDTVATKQHFGLQSLASLESDIMREMKQVVSQHDLSRIPILFENRLASEGYITIADPSLLKDCIQSLILNALSNDNDGAVIIVISAPPDNSRLTFDILDAGCGIAPADQSRIFEAFEKINPHSRGAGLGLTLAAKIAASMDGNVSLVASSQDPGNHGSHFRAEFYKSVFTHDNLKHSPLSTSLHHIPREFYIAHAPDQRLELVSHFASFLEHQGFKRASVPDNSFVIIAYTPDTVRFQKLVDSLEPGQRPICLAPAGTAISKLFGDRVGFHSGPFLSTNLEHIIKGIDRTYQRQGLKDSMVLPEARQGFEIDLRRISELEIMTPPTPPPDTDPIALLVDDNVVNLRILQMYCEKRNITYSTAINGQEAVEQFKRSHEEGRPVNLVLMDLQMPVCDGIEATRQIREVEGGNLPALPPSRILMITGQDSAQDKARSFAAGADSFYVKPMGVKALDQGIGKYFPGFAIKIAPLEQDVRK